MTKSGLFLTCAAALLAIAGLPIVADGADAQESRSATVIIKVADPTERGNGKMSAAARRAMLYGALPMSPATAIAKEAANRESAEARRKGKIGGRGGELPVRGPLAPAIVEGHNFEGQSAGTADTDTAPPDTTGAIGKTRYIQTVNTAVRIIDRSTEATIAQGSLNQLADNAPAIFSFDPQVMWDPTTNRFYYAMASVFTDIDHRIAWGFSKTESPSNLSSDWCHYTITTYGTYLPDYPKLGDSRHFILIGVNAFTGGTDVYDGSDIVAISKPPPGTGCPTLGSFKRAIKIRLRDSLGDFVFTPVPSNQIDNNDTGYVVTIDGHIPLVRKLWFFNVTKGGNGAPKFGLGRSVTVSQYDIPPNVPQANRLFLDTLDARTTQAVQAINPARGNVQSFWTQHTVKDPSGFSVVRWYEIDPAPSNPQLLRTDKVAATDAWAFNGAISPDRQVNGSTRRFGDSFVIHYNTGNTLLDPGLLARSSLHGGPVSVPRAIKNGVDQYFDFSCICKSRLPLGRLCGGNARSGAGDDGRRGRLGNQSVFRCGWTPAQGRQLAHAHLCSETLRRLTGVQTRHSSSRGRRSR